MPLSIRSPGWSESVRILICANTRSIRNCAPRTIFNPSLSTASHPISAPRFSVLAGNIKVEKDSAGNVIAWICDPNDTGVIDFHECKEGLQHQAQYIATTLVSDFLNRGIARSMGEIAVLYRTKGERDVIAEQVAKQRLEYVRIDVVSNKPSSVGEFQNGSNFVKP